MPNSRHWFLEAVERSFLADQKERADEAEGKEPHLRGGTSGILHEGEYYGACPRIAQLRFEGIEVPIDTPRNTYRQFAGGLANEDIIYDQLVKSGISPSRILREEEIPVSWRTSNGTLCTGRPDIVILGEDGKPATLFELKTVVSMWSAKSVHYDLIPKSDHLIQAAYYSMHIGAPETVLVYSNRAQFHLSTAPGWLRGKFPPGTYDVQFKDNGDPMKILAFDRVYDLTWKDDVLYYHTDGLPAPQRTFVSKDTVTAYYESVAQSLQDDTMLPRPTAKGVDGSKSYSKCDYCPLSDVCDSHEGKTRQEWKDNVILEIAELKKEHAL